MPPSGVNRRKLRPLSVLKRALVRGGQRPVRVPFGLFKGLTLNLDLAGEMQTYLGLWETETYGFIRAAAARCRWAVDVGAGSGELVLYLLLRSRSDEVHAFEPQEAEIAELRANLALNGLEEDRRVRIHRTAVSINPNPGFVALDSIGLDAQRPGFLKIDVDGQEMHVLQSGAELLSRGRVDVLVETHSATLESECTRFLEQLGYTCSLIDNAWWRVILPEARPIPHNRWLSAVRPA
jgi:precorrin-6B methylase 2